MVGEAGSADQLVNARGNGFAWNAAGARRDAKSAAVSSGRDCSGPDGGADGGLGLCGLGRCCGWLFGAR